MNSDDLMRELRNIEWLIAALSAHPNGDSVDLRWLRAQHKLLSALREFRAAQKGEKVVSLADWRWGRAAAFVEAARVA
ncbi:MAG TPA: hypothetical protein VEI03_12530 [Stellaceae bacterium]|nr:hypothetical protein [Stellaceae bacterium]